MAERVFCIDLGNVNTKVALRPERIAESQLLERPTRASVEDLDFCFSTVVAVDRRGTRPVVLSGSQAADLQPGNGVEVFRNWKKWLFSNPPSPDSLSQSPLEALLDSGEFRQLADKYGVPSGQTTHLRQLVAAARSLIGGPGGRIASESRQQANGALLATHFFIWLRQQILEACSRLPETGLKYEVIPARVAVPAFAIPATGDPHPGCKLLTDALQKAGWPLHPDRPLVSEPYSNAIGVLTKGANVLRRTTVDLGSMFVKGPIITSLKDPVHYPHYRTLVVDVGAFTTDFAAVELNSGGEATANPDIGFTVRELSVPVGIVNLDESVGRDLPKEKSEALLQLKHLDWHDFRRAVYTDGKGFRVWAGLIGGPSDDGCVRNALTDFAKQVATEVEKFCGELAPTGLQELILTGGGSFIPAVREAVIQAAQYDGRQYVKIHAPALKKSAGGPPVVKLDERFARGGSALGGASIYFEKDFY